MNKKSIYSIALGFAVSAMPALAAEETDEVTLLRQQVRLQEQQLKGLNKRLDSLESAPATVAVPAKASWADKITIKGDIRYRYEWQEKDNDTSKNRQRIRARIGAYAEVNDFTTAGIRFRTGKDANSGNQTIGDSFDSKDVYLDLAYFTMAPEDGKYGSATLGKMKYPWKVTTDMIWDSDVNPEGAAYNYSTKVDNTGLFTQAGYYKVEETSSTHDLNLGSFQIGATQPLSEKSKLTLGGSYFYYDNSEDFVDPDSGADYTTDYNIAELFGEVSFKDVLPVPFKLYGNVVNNTATGGQDNGYCGGIKFGDAKKGKWEAKVGYRRLEKYAAPAYFADSDFAGGGTDVKGVRFKAKYNIAKHLQGAVTYIAGNQISNDDDVNTLHLDLIASF